MCGERSQGTDRVTAQPAVSAGHWYERRVEASGS